MTGHRQGLAVRCGGSWGSEGVNEGTWRMLGIREEKATCGASCVVGMST